jgi:hypothetical protein
MTTKIGYTIPEAAEAVGLSETAIRNAVRAGDLIAKGGGSKGSKLLIGRDELQGWFDALPSYVPPSRRADVA